MAEQETLVSDEDIGKPFVPEDEGLWSRVIEDGGTHINVNAINRARAEGTFVGTCRHCGGFLWPEPTDEPAPGDDISSVTEWYVFTCVRSRDDKGQPDGVGCGHEFVAPDGKVLQRSARHSRMPRTFLRTRSGVIDKPRPDPN